MEQESTLLIDQTVTIVSKEDGVSRENEKRHRNIERLIEIGKRLRETIPDPPSYDK